MLLMVLISPLFIKRFKFWRPVDFCRINIVYIATFPLHMSDATDVMECVPAQPWYVFVLQPIFVRFRHAVCLLRRTIGVRINTVAEI